MPKPVMICPECGERFAQGHHRQLFCGPVHQKAFNNRRTARGGKLVTLFMAARAMRGGSSGDPKLRPAAKDAYMLAHRLVDQYIAEDRAAGRMHPTKVFDQLQRLSFTDW